MRFINIQNNQGIPKYKQIISSIEKTIETKIDSVSTIKISKAIQDSLLIKINEIRTAKPECDSITNAEIKNVLQRLNNVKKSGNNEFGVFYDQIKNEVVIYANIKEQIERDTAVLKAMLSEFKEMKQETKIVEVYPKWLVILAILGGLFIIFLGWRFSKIFM
mgnify:CR=1 FL=1